LPTTACMHCGTEEGLEPVVTFEGYVCEDCRTDPALRDGAVLRETLAA